MNAGKAKPRLQGKKPSHRRSLIKSQVLELLRAGKIKTTPAKARALVSETEHLITVAKQNTSASRTRVMQILPTARSVERLYKLLPSWEARTSGYTRVVRTLPRKGDNAAQVYVMLMDADFSKEKKSLIQETLEKQTTKKTKKPTVKKK